MEAAAAGGKRQRESLQRARILGCLLSLGVLSSQAPQGVVVAAGTQDQGVPAPTLVVQVVGPNWRPLQAIHFSIWEKGRKAGTSETVTVDRFGRASLYVADSRCYVISVPRQNGFEAASVEAALGQHSVAEPTAYVQVRVVPEALNIEVR
jgi:hypothetical protein